MAGTGIRRVWIVPQALQVVLGAYGRAQGVEPCGLLLGVVEGDSARIREAVVLANRHAEPARAFMLDPAEHAQVARDARSRGLEIVGTWHGHLAGPPLPGAADRELLRASAEGAEVMPPPVSMLVGRGAGGAPVVRAWVQASDGPREVALGV